MKYNHHMIHYWLMLALSASGLMLQACSPKSPTLSPPSSPEASVLPAMPTDTHPTQTPEPVSKPSPSALPTQTPENITPTPVPSLSPRPTVISLIPFPLPDRLSVGEKAPILSGKVIYSDGSEGPGVAFKMSQNSFARIEGNRLIPLAAGEINITYYALRSPSVQSSQKIHITTDLVEEIIADNFQLSQISGQLSNLVGDNTRLFVADQKKAELYVIRLKTGELLNTVSVCSEPQRLSISANQASLNVICGLQNKITRIDLNDLSRHDQETRYNLYDMVSTGSRQYLSYNNSVFEPLQVMDTQKNKILLDFPLEITGKQHLTLSKDQAFVYALSQEERPFSLAKINIRMDSLSVHAQRGQGDLGSVLNAFHYASSGRYLYLSADEKSQVQTLGSQNLNHLKPFLTLGTVRAIASTTDDDYLLVASSGQRLEVFDHENQNRLKTIKLDQEIQSLWVNAQSIFALTGDSETRLNLVKIMDVKQLPPLSSQ